MNTNYLVVGYKGEIGSHILNGLIKFLPTATKIWCYDTVESDEEQIYRINKSDVIFLCVPFEDTISWLDKHLHLLGGKKVIEQCSWKTDVFKYAEKNKAKLKESKVEILYMHVLYKPSITPPQDREVLILSHCSFIDWIGVFNFSGMKIDDFVRVGLEAKCSKMLDDKSVLIANHDRMMAYQQNKLYKMIEEYIEKYEAHFGNDFTTRNFKKVRELYDRIQTMNPGLRKAIEENPFGK